MSLCGRKQLADFVKLSSHVKKSYAKQIRLGASSMWIPMYATHHDACVVYTDGSVTKDQSGWGFTVKQGATTIHEDSGAYAIILIDSISLL